MVGSKLRVLTYYKEWRDDDKNLIATHSKYEDLEVIEVTRQIFYEEENTTKYVLLMSNGMFLNFFTNKKIENVYKPIDNE